MLGDRVSCSVTHSATLISKVETKKGEQVWAARDRQLGSPVRVPAILLHDRQAAKDRKFVEGACQRAVELHTSRASKIAEPAPSSEAELG